MVLDPLTLAAVALVFFVAGTIKGTVGIGLPAASVGMMALFLPPKLAITLVVVPIVVVNIWQFWNAGERLSAIRRYWVFIITMLPVLFAVTFFTAQADGRTIALVLGIVVVAFAISNLFFTPPPLPARWDVPAQMLGGLGAGVFGGLTSVWAPPVVIYMLAKRVEKDEFVRGCGVVFAAGSVPLFIGFVWNGLLTASTGFLSTAMVVPALIGFSLGAKLRHRIGSEWFRTLVLVLFLLVGLNLLRRALF
ncbi:MAG: sulfite exporter TauE/SafE family protein [Pseudomonadota bacterium]